MPESARGHALCGTCLTLPPPFTRLIAACVYKPPVSGLVAGFKYQGRMAKGRVLTDKLAVHLQEAYSGRDWPDLMVPVPLHNSRLHERGFNQAGVIARWLSRTLDIPVSASAASRERPTEKQAGLSAARRKQNIRGAFVVKNPAAIENSTVALVEDVVTTGTTVAELARVLMRAGAGEVHVWALARTCL